MKNTASSPLYLRIAKDIAARIAHDEFAQGQRIYGRSAMASEYKTSPETIRRAMKLLADMKVVEIQPQSGVTVLSKDNAQRYIHHSAETSSMSELMVQLKNLREQYDALNKQVIDTVEELLQARSSYTTANEALPTYEEEIPASSHLIGKNIGSLRFWQKTGATIIAIRRGRNVILSPGPYAELYDGDVIIFVGNAASARAVKKVIREESTDD